MRKRPLLTMAVVLALGMILAAGEVIIASVGILAVFLVLFVSGKRRKNQRPGERGKSAGYVQSALFIALSLVVFAGGFCRYRHQRDVREQVLSRLDDEQVITIRGTVVRKERQSQGLVFVTGDLKISTPKETLSCKSGKVRIILGSEVCPAGYTLEIKGKLNKFKKPRNDGAFDAETFYQSQGIWFQMREPAVIAAAGEGAETPILRIREGLFGLQQRLGEVLQELMEPDTGGVLAGMLLGDRSRMDGEVRQSYQDAGIAHVLAISALHISIFAMGIYRRLRKKGRSFLWSAVFSWLCISAYGIMTGSSVSTGRAITMFAVMTMAAVAARSYDMLNALGFWGILALWENPFLIHYTGFIFSVTAVLGIGICVRTMEKAGERAAEEKREREEENPRYALVKRAVKSAGKALLAGVGIQLSTLPVVAFCYYEIPVYAVFLNLLVIPLMSLVLVSGAAALAAGCLWIPVGQILIFPAKLVLLSYVWLCRASLKLPMARVITGKPRLWEIFLYYAIFLALLAWAKRKPARGALRRGVVLATAAFMLFLLVHPRKLMRQVVFLDVGQGLGVYFATEDGHSVFVDGGSTSEKSVGTYEILPFLKSRGIKKVDYWCISHGDEDHISGALEVFASGYRVENLVLARAMPKDEAREKLIGAARENGSNILFLRDGQEILLGREALECVFPGKDIPKTARDAQQGSVDRNKCCLVLLFKGIRGRALFPGDISAEEEEIMVRDGRVGPVDILAAAHHGSRFSNSLAFLQKVRPKYSVISCGRKNRYGHPGREALSNMKKAGAKILDTREEGQVVVPWP